MTPETQAPRQGFKLTARPHAQKLFGLVTRKERWGLSLRGWFAMLALAVLLVLGGLFGIYPFLAVSRPLKADTLIVEGWVSPFAIRAAVEETKSHNYLRVITTGGPLDSSDFGTDYVSFAHVAFVRLIAAGLPETMVRKVPSDIRDRDRTYNAALALRFWSQTNHTPLPRTVNVLTESVHARRSRLLYQKALGPTVNVGVIAVPPVDYPAKYWWRYSEGVKEVLSESAAYLYVRLFFWPRDQKSED